MLRRALDTVVLGLAMIGATPAYATGSVSCPPDLPACVVTVEAPGTPAQSPTTPVTATSGTPVCVIKRTGVAVPCFDANWGWFSNHDGCYYRLRDPQPAPTEAVWAGHYPDGAVYDVSCLDPTNGPATSGGWTWLASAPEGFGATATTPGDVAARAVDQMALVGPAIGITVTPDKTGLVGVPVWLWTAVSPTTWGPNTATASVPGLSVTATARATQIAWDMGDGTVRVCKGPGTAYVAGGVHSPTCEHVYVASSAGQPNDAYRVTATATWEVTWTGGGTSGTLTVTRSSSTTVRIGELQVLVTG
jgi:hypothetical protein